VAAIEMDGGAESPVGFGAAVDKASADLLRQIGRLLERVGAGDISGAAGGADIEPLMRDGVPGLAERTVGTTTSTGTTPKPTPSTKSIRMISAKTWPPWR